MATLASHIPTTSQDGSGPLWSRWVAANAVGETLGLGGTALVAAALFPALGEGSGLLPALAVAAVAIAAGTAIEGLTVGTAQWLVLRQPLPGIAWRTWAGATALGAGVAWTCGMLPSTLMSIGEDAGQGAAAEPNALVVYALAFAMGLLLGPVLGFAQWLVLRRHVTGAGLWMPANALAWAFGMVLVFAGVSALFDHGISPGSIILATLSLAATGAVVGGIHGLALVRLVHRPRPGTAR
ncbi:MAG: hypothetical protein U0841_00875 [Chloroflexia bacterium]